MNNFLLLAAPTADAAAADAAAASGPLALIGTFLPMILIVGVMYFLMIRPQKKREKAIQEMRSRIEVGDEIVTSGGVIGRVVSIPSEGDSIIIESGSDRSKLRIARWAIQSNNTVHESTPEAK
jgi:preprotein translocase subunit YajC